jgi:hypothetical protein
MCVNERLYEEIYYAELAHIIMEAKKSRDLLSSANWRKRVQEKELSEIKAKEGNQK